MRGVQGQPGLGRSAGCRCTLWRGIDASAEAAMSPSSMVRQWHVLRFRAQRADFYEYLGTLMTQTDGRKSLLDILADDARRQGRGSVRGQLSAHWAERYRTAGGDLGSTFAGDLPRDDIALIRVAQLAGSRALASGL